MAQASGLSLELQPFTGVHPQTRDRRDILVPLFDWAGLKTPPIRGVRDPVIGYLEYLHFSGRRGRNEGFIAGVEVEGS